MDRASWRLGGWELNWRLEGGMIIKVIYAQSRSRGAGSSELGRLGKIGHQLFRKIEKLICFT